MIFNIQRYSTHDGDGIRTLIFFKGCPLRCQWCSNPESQTFTPSIFYDSRSCKHFGDCAVHAPHAITMSAGNVPEIRRGLITDPEGLKDICAAKALTVSGEKISTEDLLVQIRKDLPFYRQDGGVTLSGGEPLARGRELSQLLKGLQKENISCKIETSLHVKWQQAERTIGLIRTYLVDLKHTDPLKFRQYTGGKAELVMDNLKRLAESGTHIVVRIPVIPGFNHTGSEIQEMVDFVSTIREISEIHFLPYHTLGLEKYRMLGMEYRFKNNSQLSEKELLPYVQYAQSKGFTVKTGG